VFLGRDVQLSDFISSSQYLSYEDFYLEPMPETCLTAKLGSPVSAACSQHSLYLDRYLAWSQFSRRVVFWPAHVPKLWDRCVMYELELKLLPRLTVSRRSKFRNARTDVNIHMQFTAFLDSSHVQRRQSVSHQPLNLQPHFSSLESRRIQELYMFRVFAPYDLIPYSPWLREFTDQIYRYRPKFISIADNEGVLFPDENTRFQSNMHELAAVLHRLWSDKAAWEK
jgi:hypothetical protein